MYIYVFRQKKALGKHRREDKLLSALYRIESLSLMDGMQGLVGKDINVTQTRAGSLHILLKRRAQIEAMLLWHKNWAAYKKREKIHMFTELILTVIDTNKIKGLLVTFLSIKDVVNEAPASCRALVFKGNEFPILSLNY